LEADYLSMNDNSQSAQSSNQPLVSVMMPAYNTEKYVGEAIESIINETYTNWELICVDDGSTDRTLEIMREYAASDPRIRVFANSENRGQPYTRNRIIELAQGPILAPQDADDISLPRRLEEGVAVLTAEPDLAVVGGGWIEIDEDGDETGRRQIPPQDAADRWISGDFDGGYVPLCQGSCLMRAGAIRAIGGYDEHFELAQDVDLYRRLSLGYKLKTVPTLWLKYRKHSGQSGIHGAQMRGLYSCLSRKRLQALKANKTFDLESELERLKPNWIQSRSKDGPSAEGSYHLGVVHMLSGKGTKARRDFGRALRHRRWLVRALIGYILTLLPEIVRAWALRAYFWLKGENEAYSPRHIRHD